MKHSIEQLQPGTFVKHNSKKYRVTSVPGSWEESAFIHVEGGGYQKALHPDTIEILTRGKTGKLKRQPCHDKLSVELSGINLDDLYTMASELLQEGCWDLQLKYQHLNPGLQAMALRNRIRNWHRHHE